MFYLPSVCHTDTNGKQRKARKNTIFNEHPVSIIIIYYYLYYLSTTRIAESRIGRDGDEDAEHDQHPHDQQGR